MQILLEELAETYNVQWTTTILYETQPPLSSYHHGEFETDAFPFSDTSTNEQKKDWFLTLNPNGTSHPATHSKQPLTATGRIPILIDNTVRPPFPVMETAAELLYLLQYDTDQHFGFADAQEQSEALQWLFFWHGGGAPYQGNLGYFRRAAEQSACTLSISPL